MTLEGAAEWYASPGMGFLFAALGILLTLATTFLAFSEWRHAAFERRVAEFRLLRKIQTNDSARLRRKLAERQLHGDDIMFGLVREEMILAPAWRAAPGNVLPRLADIELVPSGGQVPDGRTWVAHSPTIKRWLPRSNSGLADNLLLLTDDRSYDAPSYGLAAAPRIDFAAGVFSLDVCLGSFFDFINSCIPFGYEAARLASGVSTDLPLRRMFPLSDLSNRHAQIGIVTLTVIRGVETAAGARDFFLVHRRSARVTESANLTNGVPGSTFQPATLDLSTALEPAVLAEALVETVVREFCEEVWDLEEFTELTTGRALRSRPEWRVLRDHTFFLGMGFNPLNPYVELLTIACLDLARPEDAALFPGVGIDDLRSVIRGSTEGTIQLKPFDAETLRHYQHSYTSAPTLRQICRILLDGDLPPEVLP